jgi:predicted O-linked N-acetylglucosamine transferase (SPINDLY family)
MQSGHECMTRGAFADAAKHFTDATRIAPDQSESHTRQGIALYRSGAKRQARAALETGVQLDPRNAFAQAAIGALMLASGEAQNAFQALSIAVTLDLANPQYRVDLGRALAALGRVQDAFLMLQSALELQPDHAPALLALGALFLDCGDLERALPYYKQAAETSPSADTITPYLFYLQASGQASDEEIVAAHKNLGGFYDHPEAHVKVHANSRQADRKLKIGFVSADFQQHSVARFMTPILRNLDRARFELFGLSNGAKTDSVTLRLRGMMDHWLDTRGLDDASLAAWIENQAIDILIDLSGHTSGHRLGVFGRRPAPVQATYLGYPGGTGMAHMDYRISCDLLDPPGASEDLHCEKLIRLPGLFASFQPEGDAEINDLPCLSGAPFSFACMAASWRITPTMAQCWAQILNATPDSRLIIGNVDTPLIAQRLVNLLAQHGVDESRLVLAPRQKLPDYLALHHSMDLGLDSFPYNGGTTNQYALWMGVPYVSLRGRRAASRTGAGVLSEAGLTDFIADTPEAYVERACAWAQRRQDLQALRKSMRARLPVAEAAAQKQQAQDFGDALIAMWCAYSESAEKPNVAG